MLDQLPGAAIALVSVFLTWLVGKGWHWLTGPNMKIEVGQGDGFTSENPASFSAEVVEKTYIRVKVTNEKWWRVTPNFAKGCVGYLAGLEKLDEKTGSFTSTRYADFLRLAWSHNAETRAMDILFGTPHWLDVFVLDSSTKRFYLATVPQADRDKWGFAELGVYRFTVQLSGEDINPVHVCLYLRWKGDRKDFEVVDEKGWKTRRASIPHQQTAAPAAVPQSQ